MTDLVRKPKESTARFQSRQRAENRRLFSEFRARHKLSYQDVADAINRKMGAPIAKYATVVSWGTRGALPAKALSEALKATWEDCPIAL